MGLLKFFAKLVYMKKQLLTLFIVLSLSKILNAQKYQPILDSINVWSYTGTMLGVKIALTDSTACYYPAFQYISNKLQQYTFSDTVIIGKTYKKLYAPNFFNNKSCLFGWVREDTTLKRVYFRDIYAIESLLYDFSMQVMDSINIKFNTEWTGSYFKSGYYTLDSVKAIRVNSKLRKRFDLNCKTCASPKTLSWVEGVGNLGDFVYSYSPNSTGAGLFMGCNSFGFPYTFSQLLTCFEHKGKVYYDSCALKMAQYQGCINYKDSCSYWNVCGGINELNPVGTMAISPNPTQRNIDINFDLNYVVEGELNIFDVTGKNVGDLIKFGRITNGISSKQLDVSFLQNGFYFLECKTSRGSIFEKFIIQK